MPSGPAIDTLRGAFTGAVVVPGDPDFEEARRVWNGMIDRRPALIARCADDEDVGRAIAFAREEGLPLAVRGGGHSVAGHGTCDDGVVVDLGAMKEVHVDPDARTARAQPGLTWGELDAATQPHGLATTGGLVSTTGIAGLTLGGGVGWLMREHGLTVDNLRSVRLVTADGNSLRADSEENPDLFWGVRGGGGNFGVVTSFEYALHEVGPVVFGGAIFHPLDRAADLLRFYRDWAPTLPDEMTTMVAFLTAPPEPFMPEDLVGTHMVAVALCYTGPEKEGEKLVAPLRDLAQAPVDLLGPIPYVALQKLFDDSAPKGIHAYWKTEFADELDDDLIDTLAEHAGRMASPFSAIHIHHLEGAVKRVPSDATAFAQRGAPYLLNAIGSWMGPGEPEVHVEWTREIWRAMRPSATGAAYLNFLAGDDQDRAKQAYGDANYARLVELKRKFDPSNVFRFNQNVSPAA
jgi:FAD/FMN-containing dehydrogenase